MAVNKLHVKKDDLVMVIAGKDKGKTGKVLRVIPDQGRVLVENLNIVKRHTRPTQANNAGGIIEKEAAIAISNVQLLCKSCNKPARTGIRVLEDGSKTRFCKQCSEIVDK
ncbi:MAG: 50S ribosomal protein L24 [Deltaproteobacteria bacterium]|jgi:large subunit ribosomal protein L24|nr:50S ribosomal protein L24 [Deltaproteobacteria bacterium]MBW2477018.1 50S ribosomal protein L24 [Deltaproteobacteria bacterium]MBW2504514.1 50S ribosomal protein L24 [Deltaproteobacteria bacterium]MBW2520607.1 50S ribosomal protein L24 [Deltaproteobacteria bacterium]